MNELLETNGTFKLELYFYPNPRTSNTVTLMVTAHSATRVSSYFRPYPGPETLDLSDVQMVAT